MNFIEGTNKPFIKPNNILLYVDTKSNHPHSIKKNNPLACEKRLSNLSSNKEIFDAAAPPYQEALEKAGYSHKLVYQDKASTSTSRKRRRSKPSIWFNPPWAENVATNVGADFLKIVSASFPKGHPLYPLFNRNTVKISYRTTANMAKIISRHNNKLFNKTKEEAPAAKPQKDCNCNKASLPCVMGGKCVPGNVIYEGAVTRHDTGKTEYYTGLSEPSWKLRWNNHKTNFKNDTKANRTATCLSKYVWKLKDKKIQYSMKFKQLARAPSFNPTNNICRLCLTEKYFILFKPESATINHRDEFWSSCRHKTKHLLCQPHKKKS